MSKITSFRNVMPFRITTNDQGHLVVFVDFYNNKVFGADGTESPYAEQVFNILHRRNSSRLDTPLPHLDDELAKLADSAVLQQDTLLKRSHTTTDKVKENGSTEVES